MSKRSKGAKKKVVPLSAAVTPTTYPENLFIAVFGDTGWPQPETLSAAMEWALDRLDNREAGILRMRYMASGKRTDTASTYGLSPEEARAIELQALQKLRHPSRSKVLLYGLNENGSPEDPPPYK